MSNSTQNVQPDRGNSSPTTNFHDPASVHDRVLLVEDKKFYVQSGVLITGSDFFQALFNSNFKEKNEEEIELKDLSADQFHVFLQVIYPGDFDIQVPHIRFLIDLSYRFLAQRVMELCKKFIVKEFHLFDKYELFKCSDRPGMEDMKEKAYEYILTHIDSLNLIQLLQFAFEMDLVDLKKKIQCMIYTAGRERKFFKCFLCPERIQERKCKHRPQKYCPLTRNALIAKHIKEIVKLPVEMQSFVLLSMNDYEGLCD